MQEANASRPIRLVTTHVVERAGHRRDQDCTLDGSDVCTECGAHHGEPCPDCGGRGFHALGCLDGHETAAQAVRRCEVVLIERARRTVVEIERATGGDPVTFQRTICAVLKDQKDAVDALAAARIVAGVLS